MLVIVCLVLFGIFYFNSNNVYVVENGKSYKDYYTLSSSFNFLFKNGNTKTITIGKSGSVVVNNSSSNVLVESVMYGTRSSDEYKLEIPSFTALNSEHSIDFFFESPNTISVKGNSTSNAVRYYLHYEN